MQEYVYVKHCKKCGNITQSLTPLREKKPTCFGCGSTNVTINKLSRRLSSWQ